MRVRVLSAASATATTPELIKGEEVDLPDEPALKLVDGGKVEAVTPSDVEKVRQTVEDRHATAREQFVVSETSKEIAEEIHGDLAAVEPEDADKHSEGTADKKIAEADKKIAEADAKADTSTAKGK